MRFAATDIAGVFEVHAEPHVDPRGAFARLYCPDEFARAGIDFTSVQINLSTNPTGGTLRGLHFQDPPFAEAKLVRAVRGKAFDVAVDLRPDSPTFRQWTSVVLDSRSMNAIFIPEGCAHGFLTLEDDTDLLYQMGRAYEPGQARGYRYDDPAFGIGWPKEIRVIRDADLEWPAA
ncbi:dTDP-4-dehydrorhamnose 3,5-epimerase family protein [Flaviflagellibacter deserti]|uniref:dTDP-4-dehydrorhamnose 3,5-epimerase n=1 Tax=Flaviflagellibacter deserti TaxID=2267266 RepID=A0ABV9Z602_9HYPH